LITYSDAVPARLARDSDDVNKLKSQLTRFDVFRHSSKQPRTELDVSDEDLETDNIPLVSLATKDLATPEILADLQTAEERGKQETNDNINKRIIEGTIKFHDTLKRNISKTFANLYSATVSASENTAKTIKADRKILQCLICSLNAGRTVDMLKVL